jgi:hypothetical protein
VLDAKAERTSDPNQPTDVTDTTQATHVRQGPGDVQLQNGDMLRSGGAVGQAQDIVADVEDYGGVLQVGKAWCCIVMFWW